LKMFHHVSPETIFLLSLFHQCFTKPKNVSPMINNPTLTFYLNKDKAKGNKQPLYFRITLNRKKAEVSTKFLLEPKEWNETNQCTRKNGEINEDLIATKNKVYAIIKKLEGDKKPVSAVVIKDLLTEKKKFNTGLIESFDRYIDRQKAIGEVGDANVSHFGVTKKHLLNFLQAKALSDYPIESIDFNFISDFDSFLCKQKVSGGESTLLQNTRNKHHSRVRTILIRAVREGFITKNPYIDFKLKKIQGQRAFLSDQELQKITEHKLGGNESLMKVRDVFIFSCYTGLRFQDGQNLTMERITKGKGGFTLTIKQEKTGEPLTIPLLAPALAIVNKYEESDERKVLGKVLPKFSNQKLNTYLKTIADLTGTKKHLTHHVARHTCACWLLRNGFSIEEVSKWIGHTDIKTTQIYAKISGDDLQKKANKLLEPMFVNP